jgi:flagellar biogenesis protein FliO
MSGDGAAAGASYGDLLVTSLVVLAVVCVAAFVVVRVFGRWLATGRARGSHLLDVVARVPLEPRRSLYVVAVAGKTLLVGTSEMGLSVLSELDAGEVHARSTKPVTFVEMVRGAWARRRRGSGGEPARASVAPEPARASVAPELALAEPIVPASPEPEVASSGPSAEQP